MQFFRTPCASHSAYFVAPALRGGRLLVHSNAIPPATESGRYFSVPNSRFSIPYSLLPIQSLHTLRTLQTFTLPLARAILFAIVVFAFNAHALTLYVAPNGNDAWTGTLPAPNIGNTDGPLATLIGARNALRVLRGLGQLTTPTEVQIRGGEYFLTAPATFAPQDSGTLAAPITFDAYPNEHPVFIGGVRITGWTQSGAIWNAQAPANWGGTWDISGLWINGKRAISARTPNQTNDNGDYPTDNDFYFEAGQVTDDDGFGNQVPSKTRFQYRPGDLQTWPTINDAHIVVFHAWATSLLPIQSLDTTNHIATFTGPAGWAFGQWRSDQWYYVENLREALDQPGEWYVNRSTGALAYMPRAGEDMTTAEVIAPVATQLLLLQGNPAASQYVSYLTFRGLSFQYTNLPLPSVGLTDGQASSGFNAAVEATGARNCTIDRCEILHTGNHAIWWRKGSQNNALTHSELADLGAGGVRIGETTTPATPNEAADTNTIDNNYIHDGGRILRSSCGVWIGRSSGNTVSHNEIADFRFTAVSVGWQWGYASTTANNNIIEYNHIHEIGKRQLNDVGGVYTLGVSPGTIVRSNRIHEIFSNPKLYGGWGLYTDEGSSNIAFQNNIVYNTQTGGFHQNYGQNNTISNNIFAFSLNAQIMRTQPEVGNSFTFDHNLVYFNNGQLLGDEWGDIHYFFDYNLYWDTSGHALDFGGRTFPVWQAAGMDLHSVNANPQFTDPNTADFTVPPGSPALTQGFTNIDATTIGLYGEQAWTDLPLGIVRPPFTPPDLSAINEDFETTALGSVTLNAGTHGETNGASLRVSDDIAHSGARSLKFVDVPGLPQTFYPYLDYTPITTEGAAHGSFALNFAPGTFMYHEWRDDHVPYRTGPNLWIDQTGTLKVSGNPIATLPANQWIVFNITCGLGFQATGTFDLDITIGNNPPTHYTNLPCKDSDFNRINWFGFVSDATWAQTFYVDDIHLDATGGQTGNLPLSWPATAALAIAMCGFGIRRIQRIDL